MTKNVTESQTSTAQPLTRRQLRALAAQEAGGSRARTRRTTLVVAAGVTLAMVGSSYALLGNSERDGERAEAASAPLAASSADFDTRAHGVASRSQARTLPDDSAASDVTSPLTIEGGQIVTSTEDEVEVLEHSSVKENDPTLERGTEKVGTEGKDGSVRRTFSVSTVDGKEVSRLLIAEVRTEPVDEVIKVGTKAPAPVYAAPAAPAANADTSNPAAGEPVVVNRGGAQGIAQQMVAARGWNNQQFQCLVTLWNHESGWRVNATNRSSGAYGIPQALPGSKMASAGADWRTNPATQITWGLGYISARYGTPCGALGHFHSRGWY